MDNENVQVDEAENFKSTAWGYDKNAVNYYVSSHKRKITFLENEYNEKIEVLKRLLADSISKTAHEESLANLRKELTGSLDSQKGIQKKDFTDLMNKCVALQNTLKMEQGKAAIAKLDAMTAKEECAKAVQARETDVSALTKKCDELSTKLEESMSTEFEIKHKLELENEKEKEKLREEIRKTSEKSDAIMNAAVNYTREIAEEAKKYKEDLLKQYSVASDNVKELKSNFQNGFEKINNSFKKLAEDTNVAMNYVNDVSDFNVNFLEKYNDKYDASRFQPKPQVPAKSEVAYGSQPSKSEAPEVFEKKGSASNAKAPAKAPAAKPVVEQKPSASRSSVFMKYDMENEAEEAKKKLASAGVTDDIDALESEMFSNFNADMFDMSAYTFDETPDEPEAPKVETPSEVADDKDDNKLDANITMENLWSLDLSSIPTNDDDMNTQVGE